MPFGRTVCLALFSGAFLLPMTASAVSVSAVLYGVGDTPGGISPGTHTLNISLDGHSSGGAYVGQLNWHDATSTDWNAGLNGRLVSVLGPNATFATYCIDVSQEVRFGTGEMWGLGVVPLADSPNPNVMGATKAAQVTEFWNRFHDQVGTDDMKGTAFQLGLWELVNDGLGANPFGSGHFTASGGSAADAPTLNLAGQWLADIGSNKPYTNGYTIYTLSDGQIQDQIFGVPSAPLPAAFSASLATLAVGALCLRRRRFA